MADDPPPGPEYEVDDADDLVDRKQKQRLIRLREGVDEWEEQLITQARLDEIAMDTAVSLYGDAVRRFLRGLEPLLRQTQNDLPIEHDDAIPRLPKAKEVYAEREIGAVQIDPPASIRDLPTDMREAGAGGEWLVGDAPEPKRVRFEGLGSIIANEEVAAEWTVTVRTTAHDAGELPMQERSATNRAPVDRAVLQNALRVADEWLQRVNVGIHVDTHGLPTIEEFDQSRDDAEPGLRFDDDSEHEPEL